MSEEYSPERIAFKFDLKPTQNALKGFIAPV